ncbi:MAG: CopD family protein [Actinomycetota bacterium]
MQESSSPLRPGTQRLKATLALALVALFALAAQTPKAHAHAAFLASKPVPGQRIVRSPSQIRLEFTEPLNRRLSRVTVTNLRSGKTVSAKTLAGTSRDLIVHPAGPLPTAAYRVDWFSVSTDDGHPLQGSFSFGVRTAAVGGARIVEESPLARDGWLRIILRAGFYAVLFFFAGGVLGGVLLSSGESAGGWLVPRGQLRSLLEDAGGDPERKALRAWMRTIDAGWLAAAGAAAVAAAEAADAAGGLSLKGLNDYLLTNTAGLGRVATVLALALAALAARRLPRLAAACCAMALGAIALSGHANSADPWALAVLTDWIHLIAAAVWIGGIAQIAATWAGPVIRGREALRRAVMTGVLKRFGRVALPAFLVVVASGLVNALIELGHPQALWQSGYGRALAVKMGLVGLIASFSYVHALRLRPRLLGANPHPDARLERRHWRLLRDEPLVGVGVVAVAALLVAYPLPPRQLAGAAQAVARPACNPCPLPSAKDDQLAVADHVGPAIAAVWLKRESSGLSGRLRLLGEQLKPVPGRPTIPGATLSSCGPGCWDLRIRGHPATFDVKAPLEGRSYAVRLPARWVQGPGASQRARNLLVRVQNTMNRLRSLRQYERVTSGPGSLAATHFRLRAPNRFAYRTKAGSEAITIGKHSWDKVSGVLIRGSAHPWQRSRYSGGGPGFITRTWFRWTPYARAVRLLDVHRERGHRVAEIGLYDQGTPTWWRLRIDLGSMRAPRTRLIAEGHFMTEHYYDFNRALTIVPPVGHGG